MLLTLLIANLSLEISHTEEISIKQTSFLYKLMFRVELIYQYVEEFMFNIKHIKQFILNYKFRKEEFSHLYYIAEQNIEYTNICKLYWSYFIRPLFIPFSIIGITIFAIVTVYFYCLEFLDLWVSILKEYKTIYLRKHKLAYFWSIKKKRLCPVIRVEVKENK
jgi:hypothetical protein